MKAWRPLQSHLFELFERDAARGRTVKELARALNLPALAVRSELERLRALGLFSFSEQTDRYRLTPGAVAPSHTDRDDTLPDRVLEAVAAAQEPMSAVEISELIPGLTPHRASRELLQLWRAYRCDRFVERSKGADSRYCALGRFKTHPRHSYFELTAPYTPGARRAAQESTP